MSNEDKMREEFEDHCLSIAPVDLSFKAGGEYNDSVIEIRWCTWKACAAIKDAEIAAMKQNWQELRNVLEQTQKSLVAAEKEIATGKRLLSDQMRVTSERTETIIQQWEEIASRDLIIKELREALSGVLPYVVTHEVACSGIKCREPVCHSCSSTSEIAAQKAAEAYSLAAKTVVKSEHHDSRALEKMLLEAEIKVLSAAHDWYVQRDIQYPEDLMQNLVNERVKKLAKLNKEK